MEKPQSVSQSPYSTMFSDFVIIIKMKRLLIANKFSCVSDLILSYFILQRHYFNRQQSRGAPTGSRNLNFDKHQRNCLLQATCICEQDNNTSSTLSKYGE